ncbi:PspC domain-containing protein [Candidatus Methylacidithermus pantelleriae]|uniref:PspC domain protein n=1 Tax=Candidatus Methylacidithermus pantelleriae TaxID=2744239 RepID=A0A8J2BNG6_9BACT|nr:PspC domain-containing protein [Candidatus Methylacidithermus pantelleriae]CAF0693549.1 PspC domain protein [Candidatus Methylacidithermus pantelleriae]
MSPPLRKLCRSRNRKLLGVCAGLAEYFDIDPTLVRLLWVTGALFTGLFPALLLYFIFALVMPEAEDP